MLRLRRRDERVKLNERWTGDILHHHKIHRMEMVLLQLRMGAARPRAGAKTGRTQATGAGTKRNAKNASKNVSIHQIRI